MVTLDGKSLSISDLAKIAYKREQVSLSAESIASIKRSHAIVLDLAASGEPIYGVNTGFGVFAAKRISREQGIVLNRNLIYSHAVATGEPLPEPIVRAAMAIRVNTLAKGVSGIQFAIVAALVDMLNKNVTPIISSKGSLGSSGDLCLLAQIGLNLLKHEKNDDSLSGRALLNGKVLTGSAALKAVGIAPIDFTHKDGLGLINGATFSTAIAALSVFEGSELVKLADIFTSMTLEALRGRSDAFHPEIHALRNMDGQQASADTIRTMIRNSSLVDSSDTVQDAYSLRCAPQVHGSARDTIAYAEKILTKEINAATDNPLKVAEKRFISGGNFHGAPIGMISDFLTIALAELGAISERRTFRLMDEALNNGLPAMLVDPEAETGLNSGVMILQYTAAALVLENQTLASPDSVRSLPTSSNQEDHNANAYNAAVHLKKAKDNLIKILAIEAYCSARALRIHKNGNPKFSLGDGTSEVYDRFWSLFQYQKEDGQWRLDLEKLYLMMQYPGEFRQNLLSIVN